VTLTLEQPVACPGHPLKIVANGSPSGGTYAWTLSGGSAQLVDSAGAAASTGDTVYLRSFRADDSTGEILEHKATLTVTYTHPNGTATAQQEITVHKITFAVTNDAVTGGGTQAIESAGGVQLWNSGGVATMSTTPSVKITLDPSCPRKSDCAQNHEVGWMQTVLTNTRQMRYTHTLVSLDPNFLPMRDQIGGPRPWYEPPSGFTGDNDTQSPHHEDSPSQGAGWTDPRTAPAPPAPPPAINMQLRSITFSNSFHAWLAVRNKEWWAHDEPGSFAFQRNFAWSCGLTVAVDTSKAVGSRCTPASNPATIGAVSAGKGGVTPTISASFPNVHHTVTTNPAPALP
jgi:hypothetical protein